MTAANKFPPPGGERGKKPKAKKAKGNVFHTREWFEAGEADVGMRPRLTVKLGRRIKPLRVSKA